MSTTPIFDTLAVEPDHAGVFPVHPTMTHEQFMARHGEESFRERIEEILATDVALENGEASKGRKNFGQAAAPVKKKRP